MLKYNLIAYDKILSIIKDHLKNTIFTGIAIRKGYFVLNTRRDQPYSDYHITIFQDQWDEYKSPSKLRARLFHITHEKTKCSAYYLVNTNLKVQEIPNNDFLYEQPDFSHSASTREKCIDDIIKTINKEFDIVINRIANTLINKKKVKKQHQFTKHKYKIKYY